MNKSLLWAVLILNGSMLLSCQQKPGQVASEVAGLQGEAVSSPTAIKQAKPGAQVSLLSENTVTLIAGKTASVDILLNAHLSEGGAMHLQLSPSDGLQLPGATQSYDFVRSDKGQYSIKTDLYAATNGRYYLNLNATITDGTNGGASSYRSLAIIVQVGPQTAEADSASGSLKRASDETVISLPAQEQIINQ